MITQVTLPEAIANIAQLLDRVMQGEEVIISQNGQPIAHISPAKRNLPPRIPGQYAGKLLIPASFNDPLSDEVINSFLNPADPQ